MQTFFMQEAPCVLQLIQREESKNRVLGRSLTRHSVCPELVVVDAAKYHEEYKADYVGPVEDLQVAS